MAHVDGVVLVGIPVPGSLRLYTPGQELDPLLNRQPVKRFQYRCDVFTPSMPSYNPRYNVLDAL